MINYKLKYKYYKHKYLQLAGATRFENNFIVNVQFANGDVLEIHNLTDQSTIIDVKKIIEEQKAFTIDSQNLYIDTNSFMGMLDFSLKNEARFYDLRIADKVNLILIIDLPDKDILLKLIEENPTIDTNKLNKLNWNKEVHLNNWLNVSTNTEGRITQLNLADLNLVRLPYEFAYLDQLTDLDLQVNNLTFLPLIFGNLNNLVNLDLSSNKLEELPESFQNLDQLTNLDLDNNYFKDLPLIIGELKNLVKLKVGSNDLTYLPYNIVELNKLTYLDISSNRDFEQLPHDIGNLKELENLDVSYTNISALPYSMTELNKLENLNTLSTKLVLYGHLKLKESIRVYIEKLKKLNEKRVQPRRERDRSRSPERERSSPERSRSRDRERSSPERERSSRERSRSRDREK